MYIQLISVWCDGNRVWELQQDCYSYALTIATGDIIEIEEVVNVCRRTDIFCCVSIIDNSSVECSYVIPTVIAGERERERGRGREGERQIQTERWMKGGWVHVYWQKLIPIYSPTSFKNSFIEELHSNNSIHVVDKNKKYANGGHFWC